MGFDAEQITYISELCSIAGRNSQRASELYAQRYHQYVSPAFFIKQWKEDGQNFGKRGGQRYGLTESDLRDLHKNHDGSLELMSQESGFSARTIKDRCEKLGLPYVKPAKKKPQIKIDTRLFKYRRARQH